MQPLPTNPLLSKPAQESPRKTERRPAREEDAFADVLGSKNRELAQTSDPHPTTDTHPGPPKAIKKPLPLETGLASDVLPVAVALPLRPEPTSRPLAEHLHHLAPADPEAFKDLQIHVSKISAPRGPHPARLRLDSPPEAPSDSAPKQDITFTTHKTEDSSVESLPPKAPQPTLSEGETTEHIPEEELLQHFFFKDTLQTETTLAEATPVQAASEVTPELPVSLPGALHLEIQDAVGRWEMDVSRVGNEVFFEFQGDHSLRELVRESAQEISQRLSRHGDVVGAIHWRPLESSQNSGQSGLGYSEPHEQHSNPKGQNRQGSQQQQDAQTTPSPEQFSTLLETL